MSAIAHKKKSSSHKNLKRLLPLVFLDVETTGLSTQSGDRICEIAILRKEKGGKIVRWESLINPLRPISAGAQAVNNISEEMLKDAPVFERVADKIVSLIDGAALVCHNAYFDLNFLSMELALCDVALPVLPVIDTLRLARQHFSFPSNSLERIAQFLNLDIRKSHRAMADVDTTYRVFCHFWTELGKRGIERLEQVSLPHI